VSSPRPLEQQKIARAEAVLAAFAGEFPDRIFEARLQALEAASSRFGGFVLSEFHAAFGVRRVCAATALDRVADDLAVAISASEIPPALALSALAREPLPEAARRTTGAYHTDFRLARYLADIAAAEDLDRRSRIVDPACGTGMLLAAVVHRASGANRRKATELLRTSVNAADRSPASLRGALLSLASFTADVAALRTMRSRWLCQDSLTAGREAWSVVAPRGFDLVVGNPPWEKVKVTRHEFLKAGGAVRHYGSEYAGLDHESYEREQEASTVYAANLARRYSCAEGEIDLYAVFLELFLALTSRGGRIAALVPAGLIRSQRTEALRRLIFASSSNISVSIIDNRARFFEIDTRFKFLALRCDKKPQGRTSRNAPVLLSHAHGNENAVVKKGQATIGRVALEAARPDLTLPEVRSNREWALFLKMSRNGMSWDDPSDRWTPEIVREADMTRDRRHFQKEHAPGLIPLVEGRMVHHHRFGAKAYVGGTGRSALWNALPLGQSAVVPQFWIDPERLNRKARERTTVLRAGFCDITGQTNERSLMAALIPAGVACGNKVPTVTFPNDPSDERLLLWTAIANSLPFDWLLRRVVTTTVNYFVLLSLRLPRISKHSLPGRRIVAAVRRLRELDAAPAFGRHALEAAELRARIDVEIAKAYGMDDDDMRLVFEDFPLLDRGQPALHGEDRSTVTRDYVLSATAKRSHDESPALNSRLERALALGAIPYVPDEYTTTDAFEGRASNA
jgi:predicted RNA methylase